MGKQLLRTRMQFATSELDVTLADAMASLSVAERATLHYDDAMQHGAIALDIYRRNYGMQSVPYTTSLFEYASLLRVLRRMSQAMAFFQQVLQFREAHFGPDHVYVANALWLLSLCAYELHRAEEALEWMLRSKDIVEPL